MMPHPDREGVVKDPPQRHVINVRLDDVRVFGPARGVKSQVYGFAEINRHDVARSPPRNPVSVPPFATAPFEHEFAGKKLGTYWRNPAQQFIAVLFVFV